MQHEPHQKRLAHKTALITGASRGIGRAACRRLAADGAFVLIHYGANKTLAERLLAEIIQQGGNGATIGAALDQQGAVSSLFAQVDSILTEHGLKGIDILVNNAGIGIINSIEQTTEAQFDELLAVNVKAPFFITQQALSRLNNGGRIINVSSIAARMAFPAGGAYSMTKGTMNTMTLWLAKQLGSRQITVNAVSPGAIDTDMNAQALEDTGTRQYLESLSALGRIGQPADIAGVIAFLASDDSQWVSGQIIEASGGSFLG